MKQLANSNGLVDALKAGYAQQPNILGRRCNACRHSEPSRATVSHCSLFSITVSRDCVCHKWSPR